MNRELTPNAGELALIQQWFECILDNFTDHLEPNDYALAKKVYEQTGARIPLVVMQNTSADSTRF